MAFRSSFLIPVRDRLHSLKNIIGLWIHRKRVHVRFVPPHKLDTRIPHSVRSGVESCVTVPDEYRNLSHPYRALQSADFPAEYTAIINPDRELRVRAARFIPLERNRFLELGKQSENRWRLLERPFPAREVVTALVVFAPRGTGGASFGDFIIQVLPKLARMIRDSTDTDIQHAVLSIPYFQEFPWATQYLDWLGFPAERIEDGSRDIRIPPGGTLIVGSGPRSPHNLANPADIHALRELLARHAPRCDSPPFRRIYVSRRTGRRMINEHAILEGLGRRGFETVYLEDMDVAQQARLFAEASIVAGPHGAGHANIIWSQPGMKLVEVFSRNWMHPCYAMLCSMLGLEYHCLVGYKGNETGRWSKHSRYGIFEDIRIDPKVFFEKIDRICQT